MQNKKTIKVKKILFVLLLLFQKLCFGQAPVFEIPRNPSLQMLFDTIYNAYGMDQDDVKRGQRFGWYKYSEKINSDSFFNATLKYCTDRVGEDYFYQHFRLDVHTFKDDPYSEVFTIRYRFYPPGFEGDDYVNIMFKSLDFLNIHQMSYPENLPDCRTQPSNCTFLFNREKAILMAQEELIKDQDLEVSLKLNDHLKWEGTTYSKDHWYGENFFIDIRTGLISNVKKWHRID